MHRTRGGVEFSRAALAKQRAGDCLCVHAVATLPGEMHSDAEDESDDAISLS